MAHWTLSSEPLARWSPWRRSAGGFDLSLRNTVNPGVILVKLVFTLPFAVACIWYAHKLGWQGPFLIVLMGIVLSIIWTPNIGEWLASPLTNIFDGGNEPPERKAFYSYAIAHRNHGRTQEALDEIRRQLALFPNDFEGVMLEAQVLAEDLSDLDSAERALNRFCDWPEAPEKQIVAACLQIADWRLKILTDAEAAREALQQIIVRFPGTQSALLAEQRIAHLGDAEKTLRTRQEAHPVELKAGVKNVGLLDSSSFLKPKETVPAYEAAELVKHLQTHPNDTEAREKLALIYAREFKRLDMATMELAQLINEPRHKPKQIASWLNLLANLQVELGADQATVKATLGKIVERFPSLPVADLAQRRLDRLGNEFKGLNQPTNVKLGTYEQNLGLKYGNPYKRK